ncbi:unnamed protein product [Urochloa decumbens]|uniref:Uncharacterized protein n=1 Tax=Urochloa decumbens TaxID=240449 RepID=A0ABC9BT47_9POAL
MAVAEVEAERDPAALRAARILVSLRSRKLAAWPEWVPNPAPEREASYAEAAPATAPAEVAKTWAARRPRSRGRRGSCFPWRKALRELLDLAGSGGGDEDERYAASARRTVEAALCYGTAAGSGSPSTSSADRAARSRSRSQPRHADEKAAAAAQAAVHEKPLPAAPAKEPMKAPSPDTPLDYGAGGSGASSSADDAARPRGKRRSPAARGSGGGGADDDEGCSSPAKRARAAADRDEKPIPAEQSSMQIETRESSSKGLVLDLNLPPPLDDDAY